MVVASGASSLANPSSDVSSRTERVWGCGSPRGAHPDIHETPGFCRPRLRQSWMPHFEWETPAPSSLSFLQIIGISGLYTKYSPSSASELAILNSLLTSLRAARKPHQGYAPEDDMRERSYRKRQSVALIINYSTRPAAHSVRAHACYVSIPHMHAMETFVAQSSGHQIAGGGERDRPAVRIRRRGGRGRGETP